MESNVTNAHADATPPAAEEFTTAQEEPRPRPKPEMPAWGWWAIDLVLLLLVWGLFAPDRGLWQDDVSILNHMSLVGVSALTPVDPLAAPTRRLFGPWFYLAWESGHPVLVLHLLWGLGWLATALVARQIARYLAPENRLTAYLAGALTLCATSDFLTNSPVSLGYVMGTLTFLASVASALAWKRSGKAGHLVASTAFMVISIWTVDVALSAVPLLPLLVWLAPGRDREEGPSGGFWPVVLLWGTALIPYVITVVPALRDPASYYSRAAAPLTMGERLGQTFRLWIVNFTPWKWASDRPVWFAQAPVKQPMPAWLMVTLAIAGTAAFVWGSSYLLRRQPSGKRPSLPVFIGTAVLLAVLSATANAMFAGIQMWDLHYRTHFLSRVWVSLLVAFVIGALARRFRWLVVIPAAFVGFGILGGLERQGFFQASWQLHQRELASILTAAPSFKPGTKVVLYVPPHKRYLATEIHYAQQWLNMLYQYPDLLAASYWAPWKGTGCRAEPAGLDCWGPGQAECFAAGTCPGTITPYEKTVVLGYDVTTGTYRVLQQLPTEPPTTPPGYRPAEQIVQTPLTTLQRRLLMLGHRSPARWLPDVNPPAP